MPVGRGFVPGNRTLSLPDRSRSGRCLLPVPRHPGRHRRPSLAQEVKMMQRMFTMIVAAILLGTTMGAQAQTGTAYVQLKREAFQKEIGGKKTDLYTLQTSTGMTVKITNQGGKIVQILVPDKDNRLGDVVLGYETVDQYVAGRASFGAIIGRFANRIAKGRFTLDGRDYQLPVNNGPNHLHGGKGTQSHVFDARQLDGRTDRKSTRLNSSHLGISYAGFCLKKKKTKSKV